MKYASTQIDLLGLNQDLESFRLGCMCKGLIRVENAIELETMGDEDLGIELTRPQDVNQHRRADGVDQTGGDGDVATPQRLEVQLHLCPMHPDIGDCAAWCDQLLAELEGGGKPDRLDDCVSAAVTRQPHDLLLGLAAATIDNGRSAEALPCFQAVVVDIDQDELGRRIELRSEQGRKSDWTRPDNGDNTARLHLAVDDATFECGGQNVAQHDHGFLV